MQNRGCDLRFVSSHHRVNGRPIRLKWTGGVKRLVRNGDLMSPVEPFAKVGTLGPSSWDKGAPWCAEKGYHLVAAVVPWGEISVSHPKTMSPKNIFVRDL